LHWLKRPGDRIKHGDAIAEVETDKADMVLEAFEDGVNRTRFKLSEGESAPVGAVIATLKGGDAGASAEKEEPQGAFPASSDDDDVFHREPVEPGGRAPPRRPRLLRPPARHVESSTNTNEGHGLATPPQFPSRDERAPSAAPTAIAAPPPSSHMNEPVPSTAGALVADGQKFKASPLARARRRRGRNRSVGRARQRPRRPRDQARPRQLFARAADVPLPAPDLPRGEGAPRHAPGNCPRCAGRSRIDGRVEARIPHFYVTVEVDMEEAVRLQKEFARSNRTVR